MTSSIQLCIEWNRLVGKINIEGEKADLQFSDETQLKASFVLPTSGQSGVVEVSGSGAMIQFSNDAPTRLTCGLTTPGSCP